MALEKSTWKKVGYGVLAAGVGAAIFGAAHYYFLGNVPAGNIMGIAYTTMFPFLLGVLGFVGAYGFTKEGNMRNVLLFGSAAAIGFGIAELVFKQVATPLGGARASFGNSYVPARAYVPSYSSAYSSAGMGNGSGIKVI